MATITAKKAASSFSAYETVGTNSVTSTYSASASLSSGDVIQMVKLPKDARVLELVFFSENGDNSAGWTVGDGIDPNRYASAEGTDQLVRIGAGLTAPETAFNYEYSAADTLDVVVGGVQSLASAVMTVNVIYNVNDLEP